jgi:hypothetical protein
MRLAATSSFAILLAASTPAFAQDDLARKQAVEVATRVPLEKATTGAPYSAETLVEGVQVLADGNRIVRKTTGRVYRDSAGRTRREDDGQVMTARSPDGPVTAANRRTIVSIVDPVAGYSYSLDAERKIAWRTPTGASAAIMEKMDAAKAAMMKVEMEKRATRAAAATDKASTDAQAAEEQKVLEAQKRSAAGGGGAAGEVRMRGGSTAYTFTPDKAGPLEHKVIEGVPVEGRKTTTVIPAGQVGNEQPLTITSEEWHSPDLNVLVFTRHLDPRTGESTYRLTNIIRAEPDQSLFMVPPDFEIRETGIRKMIESKQ